MISPFTKTKQYKKKKMKKLIIQHYVQSGVYNPLHYDDLNADSLATAESSSIKMGSECIWLPRISSEFAALGSSHCWDWGIGDRTCSDSMDSCTARRHTGHVDCFLSHTSMQDRWKLWPHLGIILNTSLSWYSAKHIVHLQFHNNMYHDLHLLIDLTWKFANKLYTTLAQTTYYFQIFHNIYSVILWLCLCGETHCASSIELNASRLNFIVGIAATTTGARPLLRWAAWQKYEYRHPVIKLQRWKLQEN